MHLMESGRGFYEGGGSLAFSQSSSSSSSRQKPPLVPYSYNHNQESLSHQQTELKMDSFGGSGGGGGGDDDGDNDREEPHQFNIRGGGGGGESSGEVVMEVIEREHMFDKVVTPSDVGKLNRLVIPKQQAEKYFPLDSSTNEKGLLLNFEDRNGKPWRFRYSYWKSSQSYVMTKGWSRFVKEKKLDAGDVVSFQRGVGESVRDRLFIDWRRRRPEPPHYPHDLPPPVPAFSLSTHFPLRPWNHHHHHHHQLMQANYPVISPHQGHHHFNTYGPYTTYGNANVYSPGTGSIVYLKASGGDGGGGGGSGVGGSHSQQQVGLMQLQRGGSGVIEGGFSMAMTMPIPASMVYESVPVVQGKAVAKKLRLFGVNMECPISENNEHEILSSTTIPHHFSTHNLPNSSNPSLSLPPYFAHSTHPQRVFHQKTHNHDKGKSSMSLDFDI